MIICFMIILVLLDAARCLKHLKPLQLTQQGAGAPGFAPASIVTSFTGSNCKGCHDETFHVSLD